MRQKLALLLVALSLAAAPGPARADDYDAVIIGSLLFGIAIVAGAAGVVALFPPANVARQDELRALGLEDGDTFKVSEDGHRGTIHKKDGRTVDVFKNKDGRWTVALASVDRPGGPSVDDARAAKLVAPNVERPGVPESAVSGTVVI
ncbi:MAG: hypothetical protein HY075_01990 [Deltaproteobacteria bacterium]|nr:hypothetical protein [Deltaproteobacteria bacterium]